MDGSIAVESNAIIPRSVHDVWAFVSDPRNEPRWHTDIVGVRAASDPYGSPYTNWRLGDTLSVTVQFMGRRQYEVEVTGLEEARLLQLTTRTGPMRPIATYLFEPSDGGTRFTRHVDMPLSGPMRILGPVLRRDLERRNARFVENLKGLLAE